MYQIINCNEKNAKTQEVSISHAERIYAVNPAAAIEVNPNYRINQADS